MRRDEWVAEFSRQAGIEGPSAEEVDELLELAAFAAGASEPAAAHLACWMAGRSGRPVESLLEIAERLAEHTAGAEAAHRDAGHS